MCERERMSVSEREIYRIRKSKKEIKHERGASKCRMKSREKKRNKKLAN